MVTVSVVIPTYNSAELVGQAIDSVLKQTYKDYEIVTVDDGSTDNTKQLLAEKYNNLIRYVYQENGHISKARNHGCNVAKGRYIANLDADDLWLPEKLERQMILFEKYPEAGLVYCDGYICYLGREDTEKKRLSELYPAQLSGNIFSYVFKANCIPTSSAVISRNVWEKLSGMDETMRGGQDFEFFARVSAIAPVYACPEPLMIYRRHSKNTSSGITPQKIRKSIRQKLHARHMVLKNLKQAGIKIPYSINFFGKMPVIIQYAMLLWWRLIYGSSPLYTFKALMHYGNKFLLSLMGKK